MNFAIDTFPKERFGLITGSRCSPLFPLKGEAKVGQRTYAKTLANEKYWQYYDEVTTWQMEHGTMAEHFAFEHFKEHIDDSVKKGEFVYSDDVGGSPDAEVEEYGIDFKCSASLGKWLEYFHTGMDKQQKDQCQMYMFLRKKKLWKIGAFLTETQFMSDNGLQYPVKEKDRMILVEAKVDLEWQARLIEVKPEIIKIRDEYFEKLKEKFG